MTSTRLCGSTFCGSYETTAFSSMRLTDASATPSVRVSARWMRALQAAQVIPVIGMVTLAPLVPAASPDPGVASTTVALEAAAPGWLCPGPDTIGSPRPADTG